MSNPVLFLDFDGVIRIRHFQKHGESVMVKEKIQWLIDLCRVFGARIVVSSTQRLEVVPREMLDLVGAGLFAWFHKDWATPFINDMHGMEIESWLDKHPGTDRFAILDDTPELFKGCSSAVQDRLVLTSRSVGLQPSDVMKLTKHLMP